ncbi:3-oxoacyl-ACP synthase [Mucilaginibacter sp. RS28]|uniref:3-oxoacyl-ACP synthase n=1 Tax=Mucilaginibacter straminoryzae TaxID=2932774 RepID=A0A9X1WZR6_9SPHI|nr:3-oxoacyl-ACP synthase [Mucilaginibacter straminoryzae]MCJ8208524.1 3-oxoacyl-ACP synthase [Mucilaginibacter straminoryzae]
MNTETKTRLFKLCTDAIKQRIENAQLALAEIQEATENETKSSAGDKYETSREMMQQETDRNMLMLNEANKQLVILNGINAGSANTSADTGSLVVTDKGNFYISVSAGTLTLESQKYFAVSISSPIGVQLRGKKTGESFSVNGNQYQIKQVL